MSEKSLTEILFCRFPQKKGMSSNYLETVQNHPELKSLKEALVSRVEEVMEKANAKKDSYLDYAYLWTDSR